MTERQDVGEDPGEADELVVERPGEHRHREAHPRKGIEQRRVVGQRKPAIEEVLPLVDAVGIDGPAHPDHEVEGEPALLADAGDGPEQVGRERRPVGRGSGEAVPEHRGQAPPSIGRIDRTGAEVGGERDRRRPRSAPYEPIGDRRDRLPDSADIARLHPGCPRESLEDARLPGVEDELVDPQAGHPERGVEALEGIVEVVGEEDRLDTALGEHAGRPPWIGRTLPDPVRQIWPVGGRQCIPLKPEQVPGDLHQPGDLDGVCEIRQTGDDPRDPRLRLEPRSLDRFPRHPGRMDQFGVVVVAEDVGQCARGRGERIDVRVRIDERRRGELAVDPGHERR